MTEALPTVVVAYLALVAVAAALAAAGMRCATAASTGAVVAEVLLVVNAAVDVLSIVRGHRPADPVTHLGYVAVSVVLLPLLVRAPRPESLSVAAAGRTRLAVLALASAAALVVVIRQRATWL